MFMLRRMAYVMIALVFFDKAYQQIFAMAVLNFSWMFYLGLSKPHELPIQNTLDFVNEFVIIVIFLHIFIFTDWVHDQEAQYLMGWSMNGWVVLLIAYNMFFVLKNGINQIKLILVRYFNRFCLKKPRKVEDRKPVLSSEQE